MHFIVEQVSRQRRRFCHVTGLLVGNTRNDGVLVTTITKIPRRGNRFPFALPVIHRHVREEIRPHQRMRRFTPRL